MVVVMERGATYLGLMYGRGGKGTGSYICVPEGME